jgi:F0F1-type ATP synthase alpha subunit
MDLSDGIARVHGMNNVQAEELVEYVAFAISPTILQTAY